MSNVFNSIANLSHTKTRPNGEPMPTLSECPKAALRTWWMTRGPFIAIEHMGTAFLIHHEKYIAEFKNRPRGKYSMVVNTLKEAEDLCVELNKMDALGHLFDF